VLAGVTAGGSGSFARDTEGVDAEGVDPVTGMGRRIMLKMRESRRFAALLLISLAGVALSRWATAIGA